MLNNFSIDSDLRMIRSEVSVTTKGERMNMIRKMINKWPQNKPTVSKQTNNSPKLRKLNKDVTTAIRNDLNNKF